jgi:xanthine dehydrogenase/oxidase
VNAAIAVPAWHLRRPVRIVLDRDEDMHIMGQRHAFLGRYKACPPSERQIMSEPFCRLCGFLWSTKCNLAA